MKFISTPSVVFCLLVFILAFVIRHIDFSQSISPTTLNDFKFTDITSSMGIHFLYQDPKLSPDLEHNERLTFFGTGVAVADINGDGWMDILFLSAKKGEKNHLYINNQGKGFSDKAEEWGIANNGNDLIPTSALFFDYDNDGKKDLLISGLGCLKLLKNTGHSFIDVTKNSKLIDCKNNISAIPLDYNNDGFLDLYVTRYWPSESFKTMSNGPENYFNALNGGINSLYKNTGDGKFQEVLDNNIVNDSHWSLDAVFADLYGSGKKQLYIANDFGTDTLLGLNKGKFYDHSKIFPVPDRRFGMSVSLGDLAGDGHPHVYVSNEYVANFNQTGNFLWTFSENTEAKDEARERGISKCGWAWGSLFADFNLDGKEDLYITNGFITGTSKEQDAKTIMHNFIKQQNYAFIAGTRMSNITNPYSKYKNVPRLNGRSWAGHEIGCLFLNQGSHFENVSAKVGLDTEWDGRSVAGIDFDNNGSIDIVLTTQNGPPHLLKNEIHPKNNWIGFDLIGTKSNRDGTGAKLQISQGKKSWYRWSVGGRTGFMATSDPRIHVGIPEAGTVDLKITWPSGIIQKISNLKTGKYYKILESIEK